MKLAEALNQRADLQKRIAQLKERLSNNVKVQEGDQPAENPEDLFSELSNSLKELETMIVRINKTNQETRWNGKTLTEMIAAKDVLSMHLSTLRSVLDAANVRSDRYSRNEIKFVRTKQKTATCFRSGLTICPAISANWTPGSSRQTG